MSIIISKPSFDNKYSIYATSLVGDGKERKGGWVIGRGTSCEGNPDPRFRDVRPSSSSDRRRAKPRRDMSAPETPEETRAMVEQAGRDPKQKRISFGGKLRAPAAAPDKPNAAQAGKKAAAKKATASTQKAALVVNGANKVSIGRSLFSS